MKRLRDIIEINEFQDIELFCEKIERITDSMLNTDHNFSHSASIDGHNVYIQFSRARPEPEKNRSLLDKIRDKTPFKKRHNYQVDFWVDKQTRSYNVNIPIHSSRKIMRHVADKVHEFISQERPKKLEFHANENKKGDIYNHFANSVAKKYKDSTSAKISQNWQEVHFK